MADAEISFSAVSLNGGSGTVTLFEDTDGDGTAENQNSTSLADGTTAYTLSGFSDVNANDIWLKVEVDNSAAVVGDISIQDASALTASFAFSPSSPDTGDLISFDGSGSSDADGTIQSYEWDFGDGATGTGETTKHSYTTDGDYTVSLTITGEDGSTDTTTQTISVGAGVQPPQVWRDATWAVLQDPRTSSRAHIPPRKMDGAQRTRETNGPATFRIPVPREDFSFIDFVFDDVLVFRNISGTTYKLFHGRLNKNDFMLSGEKMAIRGKGWLSRLEDGHAREKYGDTLAWAALGDYLDKHIRTPNGEWDWRLTPPSVSTVRNADQIYDGNQNIYEPGEAGEVPVSDTGEQLQSLWLAIHEGAATSADYAAPTATASQSAKRVAGDSTGTTSVKAVIPEYTIPADEWKIQVRLHTVANNWQGQINVRLNGGEFDDEIVWQWDSTERNLPASLGWTLDNEGPDAPAENYDKPLKQGVGYDLTVEIIGTSGDGTEEVAVDATAIYDQRFNHGFALADGTEDFPNSTDSDGLLPGPWLYHSNPEPVFRFDAGNNVENANISSSSFTGATDEVRWNGRNNSNDYIQKAKNSLTPSFDFDRDGDGEQDEFGTQLELALENTGLVSDSTTTPTAGDDGWDIDNFVVEMTTNDLRVLEGETLIDGEHHLENLQELHDLAGMEFVEIYRGASTPTARSAKPGDLKKDVPWTTDEADVSIDANGFATEAVAKSRRRPNEGAVEKNRLVTTRAIDKSLLGPTETALVEKSPGEDKITRGKTFSEIIDDEGELRKQREQLLAELRNNLDIELSIDIVAKNLPPLFSYNIEDITTAPELADYQPAKSERLNFGAETGTLETGRRDSADRIYQQNVREERDTRRSIGRTDALGASEAEDGEIQDGDIDDTEDAEEPEAPSGVTLDIVDTVNRAPENVDIDVTVRAENDADTSQSITVDLTIGDLNSSFSNQWASSSITVPAASSDGTPGSTETTITLAPADHNGPAEYGILAESPDAKNSPTHLLEIVAQKTGVFFLVETLSTNSPCNAADPTEDGETVSVEARIFNAGDTDGSDTVELNVGGSVRDSVSPTLNVGAKTTETLTWDGAVPLSCSSATVSSTDDSDSINVEVAGQGGNNLKLLDARVTQQPTCSDTSFEMEADVKNITDTNLTDQEIWLVVDGNPVDSQFFDINKLSQKTLTLQWDSIDLDNDVGDHDAWIAIRPETSAIFTATVPNCDTTPAGDITISNVSAPSSINECDNDATVTADLTANAALTASEVNVVFSVDGTPQETFSEAFNSGETKSVTFDVGVSVGDGGTTKTACIDSGTDQVCRDIDILDSGGQCPTSSPPSGDAEFSVTCSLVNQFISASDPVELDLVVENTGDGVGTPDSVTAWYCPGQAPCLGGIQMGQRSPSVNLGPGDTKTYSFSVAAPSGGWAVDEIGVRGVVRAASGFQDVCKDAVSPELGGDCADVTGAGTSLSLDGDSFTDEQLPQAKVKQIPIGELPDNQDCVRARVEMTTAVGGAGSSAQAFIIRAEDVVESCGDTACSPDITNKAWSGAATGGDDRSFDLSNIGKGPGNKLFLFVTVNEQGNSASIDFIPDSSVGP